MEYTVYIDCDVSYSYVYINREVKTYFVGGGIHNSFESMFKKVLGEIFNKKNCNELKVRIDVGCFVHILDVFKKCLYNQGNYINLKNVDIKVIKFVIKGDFKDEQHFKECCDKLEDNERVKLLFGKI